jgi:hypothetical protein
MNIEVPRMIRRKFLSFAASLAALVGTVKAAADPSDLGINSKGVVDRPRTGTLRPDLMRFSLSEGTLRETVGNRKCQAAWSVHRSEKSVAYRYFSFEMPEEYRPHPDVDYFGCRKRGVQSKEPHCIVWKRARDGGWESVSVRGYISAVLDPFTLATTNRCCLIMDKPTCLWFSTYLSLQNGTPDGKANDVEVIIPVIRT